MLDYLQGLGAIIGFSAYIIVFNMLWYRLTGESLSDNDFGFVGAVMLPIVFTFGFIMILLGPYIIGKSI